MQIIDWQNADETERRQALARPARHDDAAVVEGVTAILEAVKYRGDAAVREFARKFDGSDCSCWRVSPSEIAEAAARADNKLCAALDLAISNITTFHEAQQPKNSRVETMPGIVCELHWRPIDTVGFYVPGGTAPLFSSVLMQAIPARLAGCRRRILCTPPQRDGRVHPAILFAAELCGITDIFAVGGAQAIAAMAYGTETIPKVDKISGPGNAFVTLAKQMVAQDPAGATIDLPAGPSEVMVIADESARADWIAADLLAQAEHDADAQVVLVTTSADLAARVENEVRKQSQSLARRTIVETSLASSRIIIADEIGDAIGIANLYAPEHLILHAPDAARRLSDIRHAGSVFLGAHTPESAGDYASGTNHILPTGGHARAFGGVTIQSFMKSMTVQSLNASGLARLAPSILAMAEAEGLDAHARAVSIRLESA